MAECLRMPNILWKIEKFSTIYKKMSPTLRFMGLKFHMIFSQHEESGVAKLQLNLQCQNASETLKLQAWRFKVDVSIVHNNGCWCMSKSGVYNLTGNEWCIWTDYISNIYKNFNQITDITYLIIITPSENLGAMFSTKGCDGEITEITPCAVSLIEDIGSLLKNSECSDFTLNCGDKSFPVHKAILSARSHFFEGMFRSDMKEASENVSKIERIEPGILEIVLRYIYTGELPQLPIESLKKVYAAADRFIVESLKIKCHCSLIENFTAEPKKDSVTESKDEQPVSDDKFQNMENVEKDAKERQMLKDLFMSREWRLFSDEFPNKAHEMCKSYLSPSV